MTRYWDMAIWSFSHSDNGHRTRKWFYILSNAAMQCIGQTIIDKFTNCMELIWRPVHELGTLDLSVCCQADGAGLLCACLKFWLSKADQCPHTFIATHFHNIIQQQGLLPDSPYLRLQVGSNVHPVAQSPRLLFSSRAHAFALCLQQLASDHSITDPNSC